VDQLTETVMRIERVEGADPAHRPDEDVMHRGPYRVTVLLVVLSAVALLTTGLVAALVP
jgi:hypothetical protein